MPHPGLLPRAPAAGDSCPEPAQETLKGASGSASVASPGMHVLCEPSECLWQVWGLILNAISPLLPSFWGFSLALGREASFFGGIQRSPVQFCSAASCDFGILAGEDGHMSFYSAILEGKRLC